MILGEFSHQKNTPHNPREVSSTTASVALRKTFQNSERKITLLSDAIRLILTPVWHSA